MKRGKSGNIELEGRFVLFKEKRVEGFASNSQSVSDESNMNNCSVYLRRREGMYSYERRLQT